MDWNAIGAIGEMLGAAGVILSLLYLANQVKSDREATKGNTIQMQATQYRDVLLTLVNSQKLTPLLAKVAKKGDFDRELREFFENDLEVDDESAIRLNAWFQLIASQAETAFRMPMTDAEREVITRAQAGALLRGRAGDWWEVAKHSVVAEDFIAAIDRWKGRAG